MILFLHRVSFFFYLFDDPFSFFFFSGILGEEDIQRLNRPLRRKTNTAQYKV